MFDTGIDRRKDQKEGKSMTVLIRSTLKLLFRNVGFWAFLLFAPLLSLLILNSNTTYSVNDDLDGYEIIELETDEKIAYYGQGYFSVKVYDASGSRISDDLLNDLSSVGMYKICRLKCPDMTYEEYLTKTDNDAYNDRMGASMYLTKDLDGIISQGDTKDALKINILSDDERSDMFLNDVELSLGRILIAGGEDSFEEMKGSAPSKKSVTVPEEGEIVLTPKQADDKMKIGYAFSFLTFGFVFCGVFVAHTAITEQKNLVQLRIMLTGEKYGTYFVSKFIATFITTVLITVIISAGLMLMDPVKLGMGRPKLILMIFLLGLVESSLSLLLGILSGKVMTSNFVAFSLWAMSSLLSGLYFPLDDTTTTIKVISYIMPQKWFMNGAEMFFAQDKKAYLVLLCITAAYLLVIISVGSVGLKIKKQYE